MTSSDGIKGNTMTRHNHYFETGGETASIRVVEGWIGNWRISVRRRDSSIEDIAMCKTYYDKYGD